MQHQVYKFLGLSILLGSLLCPAFAAERNTLSGIDFFSEPGSLEIYLHTGAAVPYHTVEATDRKLVLDIDQVDTDKTIRTNFSGARNVTHVIMQPLAADRLRLIIRGEDLGMPAVGFKPQSNYSFAYSADTLDAQRLGGLRANLRVPNAPALAQSFPIVSKPKTLAPLQQDAPKSANPVQRELASLMLDPSVDKPTAQKPVPASAQVSSQLPQTLQAEKPLAEKPQADLKKPLALGSMGISDKETDALAIDDPILGETDVHTVNPFQTVLGGLAGLKDWGLGLALFGLLLGLCVFLRKKWQSFTAGQRSAEADTRLAYGNSQFSRMAKNYAGLAPEAKPSADSQPIGLRGLRQGGYIPQSATGLEAGRPKPASRQAIQQYQRQASPGNSLPPRAGSQPLPAKPATRAEAPRAGAVNPDALHRTASGKTVQPWQPPKANTAAKNADTRQTTRPQNRASQIVSNAGNAANPEILDFLRSVAEQMEKDGKPGAAQAIQRNLPNANTLKPQRS